MDSGLAPSARPGMTPNRFNAGGSSLELRHRGDEPLDVLGTRQAVVAVLHQREHDVIAGKARGQLDGVVPWHVRILDALENSHRAAGLDHTVEQEMAASLLDQV